MIVLMDVGGLPLLQYQHAVPIRFARNSVLYKSDSSQGREGLSIIYQPTQGDLTMLGLR